MPKLIVSGFMTQLNDGLLVIPLEQLKCKGHQVGHQKFTGVYHAKEHAGLMLQIHSYLMLKWQYLVFLKPIAIFQPTHPHALITPGYALGGWLQQLGPIASVQSRDKVPSTLLACPVFPHRSWFAWKLKAVNRWKQANPVSFDPFRPTATHHPGDWKL